MSASILRYFWAGVGRALPGARDRRAVAAFEYGLMAALIALVCVSAISTIAPAIIEIFTAVEAPLAAGQGTN